MLCVDAWHEPVWLVSEFCGLIILDGTLESSVRWVYASFVARELTGVNGCGFVGLGLAALWEWLTDDLWRQNSGH